MTWFADLTPYTYLEGCDPSPPTLNVGWLEHGHTFARGDVPIQFAERLALLRAHAQTNVTRGQHYCDLCPDDDDDPAWGSAELRAVGLDGVRYAAPSLIAHYVQTHRYSPPSEFVEAVLRASVGWPEAEAQDLCMSCGSAMERTRTLEGLVQGVERRPVIVHYLACERCGVEYSRAFPDHGG